MSRRKRQPECFDVVEFLRESDGDLKSALNSLLRSPTVQTDESAVNTLPGLKLVPAAAKPEAAAHDNEIADTELPDDLTIIPGPNVIPDPVLSSKDPSYPTQQASFLIPDPNLRPGLDIQQTRSDTPPSGSPSTTAAESPEPKKRHFPIREMKLAQDAHTRTEQQVYEHLWLNAKTLDEVSRTITIGFGEMARMVRLSESNARINVRSLIAKLAMQDFGNYNCERSLGRTYRIFNHSEILKRRKEAGLLWYMRRTLAVVFVNPTTGQPLDLGLKRVRPNNPESGPNLNGVCGLNLDPEAPPNLGNEPDLNLEQPAREEDRQQKLPEGGSPVAS